MAFTSSYTDGLIQQSEYFYGTPDMSLTGSFSGSFTGLIDSSSYAITASYVSGLVPSASYAVTASHVTIESLPLVNPIVEYVNCAAITSSGTNITLPNGLLFVSSSTYEYLEVFINGLRMRYDMDYIPTSTASVEYQVTIPSGSEVTYKSLKRP